MAQMRLVFCQNGKSTRSWIVNKIEDLSLDCIPHCAKSFVSTSLNIFDRVCTFHLDYPYWTPLHYTKIQRSGVTLC
jgi:hypothetical protein